MHPFIVANVTNEGILVTDFLRMHNGHIAFGNNQFSLGGKMLITKRGLGRTSCSWVSLVEKVIIPAGSRMMVPGYRQACYQKEAGC